MPSKSKNSALTVAKHCKTTPALDILLVLYLCKAFDTLFYLISISEIFQISELCFSVLCKNMFYVYS